jgi:hypothetical protein
MRVELQEMKIKKSGKNAFAKYEYYELADILPPINTIMARNKVCSIISFGADAARLVLVNAEQPDERIEFESPMAEASLKGTHPIQNLGAVETYQRRYLYMTAFEIVENDFFDATQGADEQQPKKQSAKKVNEQRPRTTPQTPIATLSAENGELVNDTIKYVSQTMNVQIKEVIRKIEQFMHKPIKQLTDDDMDNVMDFLNELIRAAV